MTCSDGWVVAVVAGGAAASFFSTDWSVGGGRKVISFGATDADALGLTLGAAGPAIT